MRLSSLCSCSRIGCRVGSLTGRDTIGSDRVALIAGDPVQREGLGSVAVAGSSDYELLGLEPLVMAPADGDEVVDVGGSSVSVPFLACGGVRIGAWVRRIRSIRRLGRPQPGVGRHSRVVGFGLTRGPVLAGRRSWLASSVSGVRVWRIWRGTGPTPIISTFPLGLVPSITPLSAVMMSWVEALALIPTWWVMNSPLRALRLVNNSNTTSARRCFGVRISSGSWPSAPSWRR